MIVQKDLMENAIKTEGYKENKKDLSRSLNKDLPRDLMLLIWCNCFQNICLWWVACSCECDYRQNLRLLSESANMTSTELF